MLDGPGGMGICGGADPCAGDAAIGGSRRGSRGGAGPGGGACIPGGPYGEV
jgi:hypothetical protein